LAALGCACLSFAAVWLGGLNQDEGWYLYAANLVGEGKRVYRDFAFTQGPLMPKLYSYFGWIWARWGLLGARAFTLLIGLVGIFFAALTAKRMADGQGSGEGQCRGNMAALIVAMLLGCNLYHLYYLAIPKTYALTSLCVMVGYCALATMVLNDRRPPRERIVFALLAGLFLANAAAVRLSLGILLPVIAVSLMFVGEYWVWFGIGAAFTLVFEYAPVVLDKASVSGFLASQTYHIARGGFDLTWAVGSVSRLVRWYLPVFIVLGLGVARSIGSGRSFWAKGTGVLLAGFLAVFAVQIAAPFPYEDYQVPIMGILAIFAAVNFVNAVQPDRSHLPVLLVLGLTFATSFGSPLLEKWMTNGQDRFWSLKKEKCELAQLREAAKCIEAIDPGGKTLFTQDLYLAIETNRRVPQGLEMGPFSILSDAEWRRMIAEAPKLCNVAAISGYTFAIEPPKCNERPFEQQVEYFELLKRNYVAVERIPYFGQNATTLLLLKRNGGESVKPAADAVEGGK